MTAMEVPGTRTTADHSVAILLLTIDQALAARVLQNLNEDSVNQITRAMQELQELVVDKKSMASVYSSFVNRLRTNGLALGDVNAVMESILVKAFGEQKGADVTKSASDSILVRRPFAMFDSLPAEDLANLLVEEHPQIAAVFISHLERSKAGRILTHMSEERCADLIHRVATLDRTPPDVVQRVLDVMRRKVKDLGLTSMRSEPKAWIKAAAEILNNMGGGEKVLLEAIGSTDEKIAEAIRDEMFTFEDMSKLDKKSMQKILAAIDTRVLALSLKMCAPDAEANIVSNLSKRAGEMVLEERDNLGPTPLSEVLESQAEILNQVRDLMDKGEISANAADELV